MMSDEILKMLRTKEITPLHSKLLSVLEDKLKSSRAAMQTYYAEWDMRHEVYMRRRTTDKDDVEATKQGLPKKISVPMSFSQINTAVAFAYMLFTQREYFYEMQPVESGDWTFKHCADTLLQRDMNYTDYKGRLVQNMLDLFRFGVFCEIDYWDVEYMYIPVTETGPVPTLEGAPIGEATTITTIKKLKKREGNTIRRISPYRIFPDHAFHITDWRKGSYFAWDDEYSKEALQLLESLGTVAGTEYIEKYTSGSVSEFRRKNARFSGIDLGNLNKDAAVCITQIIATIVPDSIEDVDGNKLGKETTPHQWLFWIANDNRIVRAEPVTNLHGQFPASIGFFSPDQHESNLNSLAYMIDDIQGLISWFMNSRMAAVTRTVDNQVVIDPLGVNADDVASRHRVIRMNKAGAGKDVRRFLMPLEIRDSTQGHVGDMTSLISLMQMITGVNDNAMGQYNGGRRSATEARAVTNGAASRLKMVLDVVWGQAYQPQANRLLTNHRQGISAEEFALVCGADKAQYHTQFQSTPEILARSYDFVAYDGTLPSEKLFVAQQLQDLLGLLISNPMSAAAFNMDPTKVQKEIMQLRGLGTGSNFAYDKVPQNLIAALQMQNQQAQPAAPPSDGQ